MGRKLKLTPELIKEAENLIKLGNYTEVVCQYLGIHRSTWYKWMQEGENANSGLKKEFFDTIKSAEAHAEIRNIKNIQTSASEGNWHASAWYLERKFPDRWGRKEKLQADLQHTGKDGESIEIENKINLDNLTEQELIILEKILASSEAANT